MKEKKQFFKIDKLFDFFTLTKTNQVHEKKSLDVMFAFLDSLSNFTFIKKQISNDIEKSFSCQFCNAKFVVEKLLTDQLHSFMLTNI